MTFFRHACQHTSLSRVNLQLVLIIKHQCIQHCPRQSYCISCNLHNKTEDGAYWKVLQNSYVGLAYLFSKSNIT